MELILHRVALPIAHPFTISRGTLNVQPSLLVGLTDGTRTGWGEVTENAFYRHTLDSIAASLQSVEDHLEAYRDQPPEDLWDRMFESIGGDSFAMSALDMAAHDWFSQREQQPTWKRWGLNWQHPPDSSYTIGIDSVERMRAKLAEQPGWSCYKIKLGTASTHGLNHDLQIVEQLREMTDAVFRVDANCGWSGDQTIEASKRLAELGVEFIEQPLAPEAPRAEKLRVAQKSALPIVADEDCQVPADVARCQGLFHAVNVKICKCGGLTPGLRMLREARELGMQTMVGCMVESPIGISGAAQLLPMLDYADLDGAILLADAPAEGIEVRLGQVTRPDAPGNGGRILEKRLKEFAV